MTSKLDASDVEFIHPKKPASKDGGERVRLTLDQIDYPSYLVNSRFELVWANDQAQAQILAQVGNNGLLNLQTILAAVNPIA